MILKRKGSGIYWASAAEYITTALNMQMEGEMLRVQILYILANLQWWKGEEAKEAKKTLKAYAGIR